MAKIPDWCKSDGFTDEELEEVCCPHGSFTCGLFWRLFPKDKKKRCNFCKKDAGVREREDKE